MNTTLQCELDELAPVVKAWDRRERARVFVERADPYQLEVGLIDWVLASHELVAARRAVVETTDFRRQLERLGVAS